MVERDFTVWVGGVEVNDSLLTLEEAIELVNEYHRKGYTDVEVCKYKDTEC